MSNLTVETIEAAIKALELPEPKITAVILGVRAAQAVETLEISKNVASVTDFAPYFVMRRVGVDFIGVISVPARITLRKLIKSISNVINIADIGINEYIKLLWYFLRKVNK